MVITARTRNAVTAQAVQGFESLRFRQRRLGLESHKKRFDKNSQAFFLCRLLLSPTYPYCFGSTKCRSVPFNTLTAERHGRTNSFTSATKIALARALLFRQKRSACICAADNIVAELFVARSVLRAIGKTNMSALDLSFYRA